MYFKQIFYILFLFFIIISTVFSQNDNDEVDIISIVAIVSDEAITLADLINRLDLIILTSNLPNNPKTRKSLSVQVIQTLINEKLYSQEAKKMNIRVAESEILNRIALLEKRNNLPRESLINTLLKNGISKETIYDQIKGKVLWDKISNSIIKPKITINDNEITNELNIILSNEGKNEYKYSEIFLNFSQIKLKQNIIDTASEINKELNIILSNEGKSEYRYSEIFLNFSQISLKQNIMDTAVEIKKQINTENFVQIAKQMSQSSSAKNGGLVDWTLGSSIPKIIYENIKHMMLESISEPILTNTGVYILKLEAIRKFKIPDLSHTVAEIATIKFEIPSKEKNIQSFVEKTLAKIGNIESCERVPKILKIEDTQYDTFIGKILLKQLPPIFKEELNNLKPGSFSKALKAQDCVYTVMLCKQDIKANQQFALKELVKFRLQNRYFKMLSDRFISNLKRKALVDIRMQN